MTPPPADSPVTVRRAVPDDAAALLACVRDVLAEPGLGVVTELDEFTYTEAQERELIESSARAGNGAFFVAVGPAGAVVGVLVCLGGGKRAIRHCGTIGLSVRRECRDRGVGTALMRAVIDWARAGGVVTRLQLDVYESNARAIRVYEKVGFVTEGVRRAAVFRDGRYHDDRMMALVLTPSPAPAPTPSGSAAPPR